MLSYQKSAVKFFKQDDVLALKVWTNSGYRFSCFSFATKFKATELMQ
jgi:hypothetical protein